MSNHTTEFKNACLLACMHISSYTGVRGGQGTNKQASPKPPAPPTRATTTTNTGREDAAGGASLPIKPRRAHNHSIKTSSQETLEKHIKHFTRRDVPALAPRPSPSPLAAPLPRLVSPLFACLPILPFLASSCFPSPLFSLLPFLVSPSLFSSYASCYSLLSPLLPSPSYGHLFSSFSSRFPFSSLPMPFLFVSFLFLSSCPMF